MMEGTFRRLMMRAGGSQLSDAAAFLASYGPFGMAMDFTDASIAINDEANTLDYSSVGTIQDGTGLPLGPGSKLTYSAPSLKFTEQADGFLAFQAHNYALRSDTPANWTASGTALTDTNLFTENGATSAHYVQLPVGATGITGATYVLTVEVKPEGGLQWVRIQGDGSTGHLGTSSSFDLLNGVVGTRHASIAATSISTASADGYYTCTLEIVATGANVAPLISFATVDGTGNASYAGNSTRGVRLRKWHLRRTPSVSTYVATTSAAVYDLPYVFSGGLRTGIQNELAATNLALRSNDFSNASWTKSNLTAAMTATGPDNVANSASTLTATAGNATALQAITSGSAARVTSVYIKRRTGSGNIDLTQDNGSTWTTQTVTSSWTRVSLAAVTSTNPTVGIRIVTSGDEVDVWCLQHETGTAITSPIPTYAGTVLRVSDSISLATSLWPYQQNLSIFIEWSNGPQLNGHLLSLYGAGNVRYMDLARTSSTQIANFSNHTNGGFIAMAQPANFVGTHKHAGRYETGNYKAATDGTLSAVDADIVIDVVATTLAIGSYAAGSNGGVLGITRIAIVTRSWSDAELQGVTTL